MSVYLTQIQHGGRKKFRPGTLVHIPNTEALKSRFLDWPKSQVFEVRDDVTEFGRRFVFLENYSVGIEPEYIFMPTAAQRKTYRIEMKKPYVRPKPKANGFPILTWSSTRKRPIDGQQIIFEDAIGLFWGYFYNDKSGVVYPQGRKKDSVNWDDIYNWIPYPKERK